MTQLAWLNEIAWKGTAILAAAFVAAALLRRASAAARHFLWTEALAALLLLPAVMALVPSLVTPGPWGAPLPPAAAIGSHAAASVLVVRPAPAKTVTPPWLLFWAFGAAVAASRFAVGALGTRRIVRRATPAIYAQPAAQDLSRALGIRRNVAVLESAGAPVPLACGLLRPAVVLPHGAAEWSAARLATVLRHELAHIRRWDLAAQALGQVVCCLYWFHPLAWMAARRLRQERERACDDAVLASGIQPHEYAADLVDLARGMAARRRAWADAPAMAEACDLESRVRALFDGSRNRRPLGLKSALLIEAAVLALLLPVAALKVHAQAPNGALVGVVADPSGARVPGARVVARNQDGTAQQQTKADMAGEYRFDAIPAGQYVLEIGSPGFKLLKVNATVMAGQAARIDGNLAVGDITETLRVAGQKPAAVKPNVTGTPQRIKVGGMVQPVKLVQQVKPDYPADLQQAGVQGIVTIQAVISKEGDVLTPKVLSTNVDQRLVQLALDAYKQWKYSPALLNGEPIEVLTKVDIEFTLN
ncbi:MAG TPA: M56 family metallopeptidase [Bryobacteraceae bacterium]|nr:M56 family metallopeptidase [Bryobacteraceae bacterium]